MASVFYKQAVPTGLEIIYQPLVLLRLFTQTLPWALLFFLGYTINVTLHELSHAIAAYAVDVPATLYHHYAHVDESLASLTQRSLIRTAGPICNLLLGCICWLFYKKTPGKSTEILWLYLSVHGFNFFLGNLASIAFIGDFESVANLVGLSMAFRNVIAIAAFAALATVMYSFGVELLKWVPVEMSHFRIITELIIFPVVIGTIMMLLVYQPLPTNVAIAWASTSLFWISTAVGAGVSADRPRNVSRSVVLQWSHVYLTLAVIAVVRIMTLGIPFDP